MWPFRRHEVKKEPMSAEAAQAALQRASAAEEESTEALVRAKLLSKQTKPVMHDLAAQRNSNHFGLDIYRAMLNGGRR